MLRKIMAMLPEVAGPTKQKLSFKEKLKWTGIILISFFILSMIPLFGLGQNALSQFEQLSIIRLRFCLFSSDNIYRFSFRFPVFNCGPVKTQDLPSKGPQFLLRVLSHFNRQNIKCILF